MRSKYVLNWSEIVESAVESQLLKYIKFVVNPYLNFKVVLARVVLIYKAAEYKISAKSNNLRLSYSDLKI